MQFLQLFELTPNNNRLVRKSSQTLDGSKGWPREKKNAVVILIVVLSVPLPCLQVRKSKPSNEGMSLEERSKPVRLSEEVGRRVKAFDEDGEFAKTREGVEEEEREGIAVQPEGREVE